MGRPKKANSKSKGNASGGGSNNGGGGQGGGNSNAGKIFVFVLIAAIIIFAKDGIIDKLGTERQAPPTRAEKVEKAEPPKPQAAKKDEKPKEYATLYFLYVKDDGQNVFKQVHREIPVGESKTSLAIKELLKGPNSAENNQKYYSEIPRGTKVLSVKETADKIIIDLNGDFQYGGGADSLYSRVQQLIKTALANSPKKPIYLYLDGKQADVIGGEGIMIKQPLSEKSLSDE